MKKASWMAVAAIAFWAAFPAAARGARGEWTWPVRGPVITHYVNDDAHPYEAGMHRGVDIGAALGAEVHAARGGEVTYAGSLGSAGLTVAIATADGRYATSYLHLSRIDVVRGTTVATGEKLGAVGTSGRRSAKQPHLHFGVRIAGSDHDYVDPLSLLPAPRVPARAVPAGPRSLRERMPAPAVVPIAVPKRLPAVDSDGRDWGRLLLLAGLALLLAVAGGRPLLELLARLGAAVGRLRAKRLGHRPHEAPHLPSGSDEVPAAELVPQLN
jgi:hypothetical protein